MVSVDTQSITFREAAVASRIRGVFFTPKDTMGAKNQAGLTFLSLASLVFFARLPAHAQGEARNPGAGGMTLQGESGIGRPTISAVRAEQPPVIDGRLDDALWRTAAHLTTFVQQTPVEGAPATEQTEVHVAYDSERLYFGIYAHYSNKSLVRANRVDRDKTDDDDTVTVVFDPFLDQQQGYSFSVNGYGVQGDALIRAAGGPGPGGPGGGQPGQGGGGIPQGDVTWNALFASAGQLVGDGWTAEMSIPFKSLRYPSRGNGVAHRWGLQVMREINTKFETVVWAAMSRDIAGFMAQMGTLDSMTNLSTSRNFEVLPSFTATQVGTLNATTGEFGTSDVKEGGINLKYGLSSTLTLDFTYNPDFSQIESERQQIEVNQRFPVQYPEQRPFFLEGAEIFRIQGPAMIVHTRTIVAPLFGAKLTGKVGKTTLAFMFANDEAPGKGIDAVDPLFGKTAMNGAARIRYEYRGESHVGALFTDRELSDGYGRVMAYDSQLRIGTNHRFNAMAAASEHRTTDGVQNPLGYMFDVSFRNESRGLGYLIAHHEEHPEFRSDMGFIRRVDQKVTTGNISYRWWPQGWIVNWGPQVNYDRNYAWNGTLQNGGPGARLNFQFAKNINLNAAVNHDLERYKEIDFYKTRFELSGGVNASRRISFQANLDTGDGIRFVPEDPYLGHTRVYGLSTTLRPISRLQATLNLDGNRFMDVRTNTLVFDIKILRVQTTYQFTDRLFVRNIIERNTFDKTLDVNLLGTYRVNSGTAFYLGYDDHYTQGDAINADVFPGTQFQRTNRAIFTKLQYLFRNGGSSG